MAHLQTLLFSASLLLVLASASSDQQQSLDEAFLQAVQNRNVARVSQLLGQGANVYAKDRINGYFALQYAINWPDAS